MYFDILNHIGMAHNLTDRWTDRTAFGISIGLTAIDARKKIKLNLGLHSAVSKSIGPLKVGSISPASFCSQSPVLAHHHWANAS